MSSSDPHPPDNPLPGVSHPASVPGPANAPRAAKGLPRLLVRRLLPAALVLGALVAGIALVGFAQRLGWVGSAGESAGAEAPASGTIFTCPMHPQIRQPGAGRCPICGMELVPASTAATDLNEFAVRIEPAQRRLANIQTAPVEQGPLQDMLQTVGAIAVDESRQATIAAYIDGRLERLFADYTGVEISKGDHLAVIYSPQLYGAQVEYVEARRAVRTSGGLPAVRQAQEALAANTRQRLREFGMTDEQLAELEKTGEAQSRLTIYAPQGGTVVEKLAVEGSYVEAGDPIYRIAELSTVWLMLKLFPEDASRIRFGQRVEAVVQSLPGETLVGRVAFIDPTVEAATRTVGVRVELLNEDRRLRPGDYASARIAVPIGAQGQVYDADLAGKWISPMHPQIIRAEPGNCPICGMELVPTAQYGFADEPVPQPSSVYVPRSAVLLAGGNSVVYVEAEPGLFELRPVRIGPILGDTIVILEGLAPGEQVATAGNFLIDSQMQLAGKPSLIDPTARIRQPAQEGPLKLPDYEVVPLASPEREHLERLYDAYFKVQQALAADRVPAEAEATALRSAAGSLRSAAELPDATRQHVEAIADAAEHLHHLELPRAREQFKTISRAVIHLAAQVRSADAETAFVHFFCPMVKGGGGDWLQAGGELANPYYGSEMLRCGEQVKLLPAPGEAREPANDQAPAASPAAPGGA